MNPIGNKNVLIQLREMRDSLTPVSQRLADYVLENDREILALSIKELAKRSKTSDAAVMRFCKSIGFASYRNFIVNVSAAISTRDESSSSNDFSDISPGDDLLSIIKNISNSNHESIDNTLSVLELAAVERAVELLCGAERIVFCGVGASGIVALDMQQKFMRIDKPCFAYADSHSQMTCAALMGPNDVAVLFSNSGKTLDILDTMEVLRTRGVPTVAVTRCSNNALSQLADVVLFISTPEMLMRSAAMGSRIAMLNLVDILFAGVVSRDYKRVRRCLQQTAKALEVRKR